MKFRQGPGRNGPRLFLGMLALAMAAGLISGALRLTAHIPQMDDEEMALLAVAAGQNRALISCQIPEGGTGRCEQITAWLSHASAQLPQDLPRYVF